MIVHRQSFGGADRAFALPLPMLMELERERGAGIGVLSQRILSGGYSLADLHATIRLALVGGGTDPEEAAALVAAYVEPRPIMEAWNLALTIMDAAWNGVTETTEPANA